MSFRKAIVGSFIVWAVVVLGTYIAGEQVEVVALHTRDASGKEFSTRIWIVDLGEVAWVRVANPRRGWYLRLLANPRVELERGGRSDARLAIPESSPETLRAVDAAFAAKYGLVDRWYGLLVRRGAVPIRLVPADPDARLD